MSDIKNILIFVSDSLRWGYLPDEFTSEGIVFKTVAQAPHSPPSFSTLSTGVYPSQHGVRHFGQRPAESVDLVYDIPDLDAIYFNEGRYRSDPLYRMFEIENPKSLADLTTPFWYLERDTTTHAPYVRNGFFDGTTVRSYLTRHGYDWAQHRDDYREVIDDSINLLKRRLQVLERLGMRDETLVVFTADHGELFGEYGEVLHTAPLCPELVYVPTVVFHPDLEASDFAIDPQNNIIEHVDLIETCLSAIGFEDQIATEGTNILETQRPRDFGYSEVQLQRKGVTFYEADGIWWRNAGVTDATVSKPNRLIYALYQLVRSPAREYLRQRPREIIDLYLTDTQMFSELPISTETAIDYLERFRAGLQNQRGGEIELDEQTESALTDLGYLQ